MEVKCLAQWDSATLQWQRPAPGTSQSKVPGRSHCATEPSMHMAEVFRYRDTEAGYCQGACHCQWFLYIPLKVSKTASPFMWSCEPWEIHSLQYWRVRNKSPEASPAMGLKTWAAGATGVCSTSYTFLMSRGWLLLQSWLSWGGGCLPKIKTTSKTTHTCEIFWNSPNMQFQQCDSRSGVPTLGNMLVKGTYKCGPQPNNGFYLA